MKLQDMGNLEGIVADAKFNKIPSLIWAKKCTFKYLITCTYIVIT